MSGEIVLEMKSILACCTGKATKTWRDDHDDDYTTAIGK